jgi:hypothetical protein
MDFMKFCEIVCLISVASGDVVLMFPKRWGLHLFNVGNFFAFLIYYWSGLHYLLALVIFLTVTNTIAIFRWRKKGIG